MPVYEIYVEKKPDFAEEARAVAADLRLGLQIENITSLRIINRYFVEGISPEDFESAKTTIFSEPPADIIYDKLPALDGAFTIAVEYLPGQYDQRADSAAQCISLAFGKERPVVRTAKIYAVYGSISASGRERVKSWLINPVECREALLDVPQTLAENYPQPQDVEILNGFTLFDNNELEKLRDNFGLAMDIYDMQFCQAYFRDKE